MNMHPPGMLTKAFFALVAFALVATAAAVIVAQAATAQTVPVVTVTRDFKRVYERQTATFTVQISPAPANTTKVNFTVADQYKAVNSGDLGSRHVVFSAGETTKKISVRTKELVFSQNVQRGSAFQRFACQKRGAEEPYLPPRSQEKVVISLGGGFGTWGSPSGLTNDEYDDLVAVCNGIRVENTMGFAQVVVSPPDTVGDYSVGSPSGATTDVRDKSLKSSDPRVVSFGSGSYSAGEASGQRSVSVGLSLSAAAPSGGLTVSFTVGGSATSGSDYSAFAKSATFAQGSTSASVSVAVLDDSADENAETIILTLADGAGYDLGSTKTTTITIADDDDPPPPAVPVVSFGSGSYSAGEASGQRSVSVGLSLSAAAPSGGLSVSFTVGGSATSGSDYSALTKSVRFAQGVTSASVPIQVLDDSADDDSETITLTLVDGASYDLGSTKTTTITIADDDDPPPPPPPPPAVPVVSFVLGSYSAGEASGQRSVSVGLSLSAAAPSGGLTVSFTVGGSATSGSDYSAFAKSATFAQGSTSASVPVQVLDDSADDDSETIILTLADGAAYDLGSPRKTTITITDDDDPPRTSTAIPTPTPVPKSTSTSTGNPGTSSNPGTSASPGSTPAPASYSYTPVPIALPPVEVTIAQEAVQTILEGEAAVFTVSYEHPMRLSIRAILEVESDASIGDDFEMDYQMPDSDQWVSLGRDANSLAIDLPVLDGDVRVRVVSLHVGTQGTDIPLKVTVSDRSFVLSFAIDVVPEGKADITLAGSGAPEDDSGSDGDGDAESDDQAPQDSTSTSDSDSEGSPPSEQDAESDPVGDTSEDAGQQGAGTAQEAQHFLTYTVKPGETLESIAQMVYGDAGSWERIFEANRGRVQNDGLTFTSGDSIRYGWELYIPAKVAVASYSGAASAPYVYYTVQSGDSLGAISMRAYGDAGYWTRIEAANMGRRQQNGQQFIDANSIEVGWMLRIPVIG